MNLNVSILFVVLAVMTLKSTAQNQWIGKGQTVNVHNPFKTIFYDVANDAADAAASDDAADAIASNDAADDVAFDGAADDVANGEASDKAMLKTANLLTKDFFKMIFSGFGK